MFWDCLKAVYTINTYEYSLTSCVLITISFQTVRKALTLIYSSSLSAKPSETKTEKQKDQDDPLHPLRKMREIKRITDAKTVPKHLHFRFRMLVFLFVPCHYRNRKPSKWFRSWSTEPCHWAACFLTRNVRAHAGTFGALILICPLWKGWCDLGFRALSGWRLRPK